ncbi:MAG: hypothetical protein LQ337_005479 [Flavoplaca oasis]|nr:MAG: hypothetical protein LQ337_005479 [Flavoplaca oasis]
MSFNSLNSFNPFQAPNSNVSSPGSLYLSPPISTPSFMSPPPRLEAEDYLNSHGGKKKHSSRLAATPKGSPLALHDLPIHRPTPPESDERSPRSPGKDETEINSKASDGKGTIHNVQSQTQKQCWLPSPFSPGINTQNFHGEIGGSFEYSTHEINQSPAVASLKRLNESGGVATELDEVLHPSLSALGPNPKESNLDSPDAKQSDDDLVKLIPWYGIRRRSTAPRDRAKQRLRKDETSATTLGLEIPATITLRKATGLFQLGPDIASDIPILTDEINGTMEGSTASPASCTLVNFDSQSLNNHDYDHLYQATSGTTSGCGFSMSDMSSMKLMSPASRRQSLAETAVTVSNTFPSPAILASPISGPSSRNEAERRFSVVNIKSRKSFHQVIWRENDTSSNSEKSSSSSSLTRSASDHLPERSENSPDRISPAGSKHDTGHTSSLTLHEQGALTTNGPVTAENLATFDAAESRPEGQMLQWSISVAEDGPYDPTDSSEEAKSLLTSLEKHDEAKNNAPFGTLPAIPQLSFPFDEDGLASGSAPGTVRRGSFAVDPISLGSVKRQREAGNRRSISITPLMLLRLGDGDANASQDNGLGLRRCSRVD